VGDAASLATEAAKLLLSLGVRKEPAAARAYDALDHPPGTVESLDGFEEAAWGDGGVVVGVSGVDRGGGIAVGGPVGGDEAERVGDIRRYGGDFRWWRCEEERWWCGALALVVLFEEDVEDGSHGVESPQEMEPSWVGGENPLDEAWANRGFAAR
jgi:hypothetical protein